MHLEGDGVRLLVVSLLQQQLLPRLHVPQPASAVSGAHDYVTERLNGPVLAYQLLRPSNPTSHATHRQVWSHDVVPRKRPVGWKAHWARRAAWPLRQRSSRPSTPSAETCHSLLRRRRRRRSQIVDCVARRVVRRRTERRAVDHIAWRRTVRCRPRRTRPG